MRLLKLQILFTYVLLTACNNQQDFRKATPSAPDYSREVSESLANNEESPSPDSIFIHEQSIVFFSPKLDELHNMVPDQSTRDGLTQAVGDFAYYARLVSDSMKNVPVYFTDKRYISFNDDHAQFVIDRYESSSPIGLIIYNGETAPVLLPGMQTHLSLQATISEYFYQTDYEQMPLLDYFDEADQSILHIYSSHSEILNQTGRRIDPIHYRKFGEHIASRAGKYHMSVFAYQKFALSDSLYAIICRIPSRYDESAIRLYIWDAQVDMVIDEIELAENVWNDQWIMVKDSWITRELVNSTFAIVQRKKEAQIENSVRTENDSLYRWQWTGSGFIKLPPSGLTKADFPLQDWQSYNIPKAPTELTIVDEDHVWLPLTTGDLTWENIIMELPKPYAIDKEPIQNQLAANQIDTLVTISQPQVTLRFYRSPEDNLLVSGVISDQTLNFRNNLKIGMKKSQFIEAFHQLNGHHSIPDLIKVSSKNHDRVINYFFQEDTLARIEVTNFIH